MRLALARAAVLGLGLATTACAHVHPKTAATGGRPSVAAETTDPAMARADAIIADVVERYAALVASTSPERATALGLHEGDAELDDRTLSGFEANVAREAKLLEEVESLALPGKPSLHAEIDRELVRRMLRVSIERKRTLAPLETDPSHYLGPVSALFEMLARPEPSDAACARAAVARLEKIPAQIGLAKANLKRPAKLATEVAIEDARGVRAFLESKRAYLVEHAGDVARTKRAVDGAIAAYEDYVGWLGRVLLRRSDGKFAVGRAFFDFLLRESYALEEDADAVRAVGQRAFDRTKTELHRTATRIGGSGATWTELSARSKSKHPTGEELVGVYRREVARARSFLAEKGLVAFPHGEALEVIETPEFARATTQAAYDMPPPLAERGSKGFLFVTPADTSWPAAKQEEYLREHGLANIVDTVTHEAYPGHHLQIAFARRHPSKIRRMVDSDIFCEGWGLYAEELMAEHGFYTPEERLIQLEWMLVRAARVLIDVGLHTGSMTLEEATALLVDEVDLEPVLAKSEVRRYALSATQPLSYVLGAERIRAMRDRYLREVKDDVQAFHEAVLSEGSIPPAFVERAIFAAR